MIPVARRWADLQPQRRLALLVRAVAVGGGLVLGLASWSAAATPEPVGWPLAVVALATLWSDATFVNLRMGSEVESFTWSELVLVLGLALLPPSHLVLTALCIGVAYAASGRSAVKVVFGTCSYAIGVGLAALVVHGIGAPSWDRPLRSAAALAAGTAVFSWWNGRSVGSAIALAQGMPIRAVYAQAAWLRRLVSASNLLLGLCVLALGRSSPALLVAVPTALAAAYALYRSHLRGLEERAVWRHMEAISGEFSRLDEAEVASVGLARALAVLDADEVALRLRGAPPSTVIRDGAPPADAPGTRVAVPVPGPGGPLGELEARFHAKVTLTGRERQLLSALAGAIGAAVENAREHRRLRDLAAHHAEAALHDPLTGLANRPHLLDRIGGALAGAFIGDRRVTRPFALLLVDLDHFKQINDSRGHAAGDAVLCEVALRLRAATRPEDVVARLGGDEFVLLLSDPAAAEPTASRLVEALARPAVVDGLPAALGASIGIARFPQDGATAGALLHAADAAMYRAKMTRGAYCVASEADGRATLAELRDALSSERLAVYFQPQHDVATGAVVGAEALLRWDHPVRGMTRAAQFFDLVEGSELLHDVTIRVLDLAVAACASWSAEVTGPTVTVNLALGNLEDGSLPAAVRRVLARHGLPAHRLMLEVDEVVLADPALVARLALFAEVGAGLAIDHYGTGGSTVAALQRSGVQQVTLDGSVVAGLAECEDAAAVARALVALARTLGLRTVAAQVECPAVLARLGDLACDAAQGHHLSPPLPADEVRALLLAPAGV